MEDVLIRCLVSVHTTCYKLNSRQSDASTSGRAVHEIQHDKDFNMEWLNIHTEEDKNIKSESIKLLSFITIRSVVITKLETGSRHKSWKNCI